MNKNLIISVSPHITSEVDVEKIMWSVIWALIPATIGAGYFFGIRAIIIIIISVITAIFTEYLCKIFFKREINIFDGSAIITGILLAFNLPPKVPYFVPIVGSFFAIFFVKQLFGGLGYNFVNPALAARAFLMVSFPQLMTASYTAPYYGTISGFDAVTQATPLTALKNAKVMLPRNELEMLIDKATSFQSLKNLFFGNVGGCLGETSAILLLIGAFYLLIKNYIDYRIPLSYLLTCFLLSLIILPIKRFPNYHLFQLLSGGLILGAFFMATDYVTTPITKKGKIIFGIGCGILTMLIRHFGGYPEGVSFSILLMNVATPLIERYTKPRVFGKKK
jgi:electron transport complex protein RnfD